MKTTQCERILRHLKDFGSISDDEAGGMYGIRRLASRIYDLRQKGYVISSETVKGKNRYGEVTHYSVYRLKQDEVKS